jgi:hypothetical protein
LITVEIAAYLGSSALAFGLYAYFFYWFASQNKKIDVYVQPKIFNWKIKVIQKAKGNSLWARYN